MMPIRHIRPIRTYIVNFIAPGSGFRRYGGGANDQIGENQKMY